MSASILWEIMNPDSVSAIGQSFYDVLLTDDVEYMEPKWNHTKFMILEMKKMVEDSGGQFVLINMPWIPDDDMLEGVYLSNSYLDIN